MSFYINDFKQHLQKISDEVDQPYDEQASRKNAGNMRSIEETYNSMSGKVMPSTPMGRQQTLNEQGMMSNFNTNATRFPQTGGGLFDGNQSPSMMSNNSGTAVPNYKSGRGPGPGPRPEDDGRPGLTPEQRINNLMSAWGTDNPVYDYNGDGVVDGADLGILLGSNGEDPRIITD